MSLVDEILDICENELFIEVDGPDHNLMTSGLLDSLLFVELLVAVELRTGETLALSGIDPDRMQTPNQIAAVVSELTGNQDRDTA